MKTDIPIIETSRLVLRPFTEGDVDSFHDILCEPGMLRYFPRTEPPPRDQVEAWVDKVLSHWEERGYGLWAVEPKSQRVLVGRCGLQYLPDTDEIEADGLLSTPFWNKGYATEAADAALGYGFNNPELVSVVGIVHPDNAASRRVLEKIGMRFTERKPYFGMDCLRYAIDRERYLKTHDPDEGGL